MPAEKSDSSKPITEAPTPLGFVEPIRRRAYVYRESSDGTHELYGALAAAQGEIGSIPKRHKSHYGMYADLSDIRDYTHRQLAKHGLSLTQTLQLAGVELVLVTTLGHKSGQWVSSVVPIRMGTNPQQTASFTTYMRRMSIAAMLNLATEEEDDGESAAVAAASGAPNGGETALYSRARAAITSADSLAELREKVALAEKCHTEGKFTVSEIGTLRVLAERCERDFNKGATSDAQ